MCRGGKDNTIRRCASNPVSKVETKYRKMLKYRADKEEMSVSDWQASNPEVLKELLASRKAEILSATESEKEHFAEVGFQPAHESRKLLVPTDFDEYLEYSSSSLDSAQLSREEESAVTLYTDKLHQEMNRALRRIGPINISQEEQDSEDKEFFESEEDFSEHVQLLDSALSHRQDKKRVLYRGVGQYGLGEVLNKGLAYPKNRSPEEFVEDIQSHYALNKIVTFDSYTSTSHSGLVADNFADLGGDGIKVIYEVKTNAGINSAHLSEDEAHAEEREVILPRGLRFRVDNVMPVSEYSASEITDPGEEMTAAGNYVIVQMAEVDENGQEMDTNSQHLPTPFDSAEYFKQYPPEYAEGDEDDWDF